MSTEEQKFLNEEMKERAEHQSVLLDIQSMLGTQQGRSFFKYLFKNLDVGNLPPVGITGELLMDRLGFLRAGNSIFKIVAEANPQMAGEILAKIEKERNEQVYGI